MTDPKYTTPSTEPTTKKGTPMLTAVLAFACVALIGVIGYGIITAVDEEPSTVDVEIEAPEIEAPEIEVPEIEVPEIEVPEIESPELPEVEFDLNFEEPEFDVE